MRRSVVPAALTVALVVGLLWYVRRPTARTAAVIPQMAPAVVTLGPEPPRPGSRRCGAVTAAPPSDSGLAAVDAEFYRAIVTQAPYTDDPASLVVEAVSIPLPRLPPDRDAATPWPVAVQLIARDGYPACFTQTADRLPAGARLVTADQIPRDRQALAAAFGGARQSFAFSRALFGPDQLDAVVYYDRFCHVSCGVGEWVWFHRDHAGESWRIAGKRWSWIN